VAASFSRVAIRTTPLGKGVVVSFWFRQSGFDLDAVLRAIDNQSYENAGGWLLE